MRSLRMVIGCLGIALLVASCNDNGSGTDMNGPADLSAANDLAMPDLAMPDLATPPDLAPTSDATPPGDGGADGFMCAPNGFIDCTGSTATYCNAAGDGTTAFDCGAACGSGATGCGQCTTDVCAAGTLTPCDSAHDKAGAPMACVTLKAGGNTSMCADGTSCLQCAGATVCGDGTSYGTAADTSYTCNNGVVELVSAKPCAFGCDLQTGACRDLVPANQAGQASHLASGDTFTCTGAQDPSLAALTAGTGDTLTFDTTAATIQKVNGTTTTDYTAMSKWGASYTPTGSGTSAIVAHVKSLSVTAGANVVVTGSHALILLVDGTVSFAGASGSLTILKLSGSRAGGSGPGAPSTNGTGGLSTGSTGSGGAGHGTAGAAGGQDSSGVAAGGVAGAAYGGATGTEILEAGAAGGAVSTTAGGVGGGGLQISACGVISVGADVIVNASGGGGRGGPSTSTAGGSGGGSGGTLLFEGASFAGNAVGGELVANGAGGGGGAALGNPGKPGGEWDPATSPTTAATGGMAGAVNAGTGGSGGVAGTGPTAGAKATTAPTNGGGGGGGAVGRIFLNVSPLATAPTAATSSPAAKASVVCVTSSGAAPATCNYP